VRKLLLAAITLMTGALLAACGSSPTNGPALTISITVSPTTATVNTSATQVFTATVSPSNANQAVSFALSGTACTPTPAACGTLGSATGSSITYTAPATAPNPNTVTLTATAAADPSKTAVATITVTSQVTVAISVAPATATLVAGSGSQMFTATVTPSAVVQTVTWALSGTGCSGNTCGTLDSATNNPVTYTPPTAVVTGPVMLTATATADTTKTATANITIVATANSLLNGHYAFQLNGFTAVGGFPVAIAGAIVTDGNGNITGGEEDVNTNGTIVSNMNLSGTYSVASGLQGTFILTSVIGTPTFAFAINAQGTAGSVIEFDPVPVNFVSGSLQAQVTPLPTLAQLAGEFAFRGASNSIAAGRTGILGRFTLQPAGTISNGLADISASSTTSGVVLANGSLTGSFTAPDVSGRGTAQLTPQNQPTETFAYYVVNGSQLLFIETDIPSLNPLILSGVIETQQLNLNNTSLNAPSVFNMTGLAAAALEPSVVIGTFTGSSTNLSITGSLDGNDGGLIITSVTALTGSFTSISTSNGRGTISFTNSSPSIASAVFYLTAPETGFLLENTAIGTNEARVGSFEPQLQPQGGAGFSNTSLGGNYVLNAGGSATADIPNLEGVITVDNLTTSFSGMGSVANPVPNPAAIISGTYAGVAADGRGTTNIPNSPFGSPDGVFYLVSPTKFVLIGTDLCGTGGPMCSGVTTATGQ
jgi:hypothetical protein